MKLDQIVLIMVVIAGIIWIGAIMAGMMSFLPFGLLGLIPLAIVIGIIGRIVYQRVHNEEDDYYEKNVDK